MDTQELDTQIEQYKSTLSQTLQNLDDEDKLTIFEEYVEDNHYDEQIYDMGMLNELVDGLDFASAYNSIDHDNFNLNDDYLWYDRLGNIVSGSLHEYIDENFYADEVAKWIENSDYSIHNIEPIIEWVEGLEELEDKRAEYDD